MSVSAVVSTASSFASADGLTAPALFQTLKRLGDSLRIAPESARLPVAHLALRTALHPLLRPYLLDPLLPLGGEFPSLDAQVGGILDFGKKRGLEAALLGGLCPEDRRLLCESIAGAAAAGAAAATISTSTAPAIGSVWAALYIRPLGTAVPCRISAAYLPIRDPKDDTDAEGSGAAGRRDEVWRDPLPLRPLGAELAASAQEAFAAALEYLEISDCLFAPLLPAPIVFDICLPLGAVVDHSCASNRAASDESCPETIPQSSDAILERATGASLGLPLALAFLSALSGLPLPGDLGATGAIVRGGVAATSSCDPGRVLEVSWIAQKADALAGRASRLLAPEELVREEAALGRGDICSDDKSASRLSSAAVAITRVRSIREAVKEIAAGSSYAGAAAAAASALADAPAGFTSLLRADEGGAATQAAASVRPPTGSGTTFLCTRIEALTALWESYPVAMREAVTAHDRLVERAILREGGYIFRRTGGAAGEGFFAAFRDAESACRAALRVQGALFGHRWPASFATPLKVQVGIYQSSDPPGFFRGDYFGRVVHQATRLVQAGHGGQILVSGTPITKAPTAHHRLQEEEDTSQGWGWRLRDLGVHRLPDLLEPMPIFQLGSPRLPAQDFPALRTLERRRHNLPLVTTALLGREAELSMLSAILDRPEVRLVTLLGPGGVGKTRLALQAAAERIGAYPDGVFFVSLCQATDSDDAASAIIDALELRSEGSTAAKGPIALVKQALQERRMLLLLDNFENALPAAPFISEILSTAPGVTCLVTSRALLQVRGEHCFPVEPLALPDPTEAIPASHLPAFAAAALFCERAREHVPDWSFSEADALLVQGICIGLDGLPLAIELAAARLRVLTLAQLHERITADALPLLVTRQRDLPERHRALEKTLWWSFDLLADAEKDLFARLSVFGGSFSLDAAEAVMNPFFRAASETVLDLLGSLVNQSLVVVGIDNAADAAPRGAAVKSGRSAAAAMPQYHLLQTIRSFARERLQERGSVVAEETRAAHARYYKALAHGMGAQAATSDEVRAFDILEGALGELRRAYESLLSIDPGVVPDFVLSLCPFLQARGFWREWRNWLSGAATIAESASFKGDGCVLAHLQLGLARVEFDQGDRAAGLARAESVLDDARSYHDTELLIDALHLIGLLCTWEGKVDRAALCQREALALSRGCGDPRRTGRALTSLGLVHWKQGDRETARRCYGEAISLLRTIGDKRGLSLAINNLAVVYSEEEDHASAYALVAECLELSRNIRNVESAMTALINLGLAREKTGDIDGAVLLLVAAERLCKDMGHSLRAFVGAALERCETVCGKEAVLALREDFARRSPSYLQQIDRRLPTLTCRDNH